MCLALSLNQPKSVCAVCVLRDLGCVLVLSAVLEALSLNRVCKHSIDCVFA